MNVVRISKEDLALYSGHGKPSAICGAQCETSSNALMRVTVGSNAGGETPVIISVWMRSTFVIHKWSMCYGVPRLTKDYLLDGFKVYCDGPMFAYSGMHESYILVNIPRVIEFLSIAFDVMTRDTLCAEKPRNANRKHEAQNSTFRSGRFLIYTASSVLTRKHTAKKSRACDLVLNDGLPYTHQLIDRRSNSRHIGQTFLGANARCYY